MRTDVIEIRTTVGDATAAATLARELVARGAAACVQVEQGLSSTYRWHGEVETASEHRLTIKSTTARLTATLAAIRDLHPYELPEIIWSAVEASPEYAAWVADAVASPALAFEASLHPLPAGAMRGAVLSDPLGAWPTLAVQAEAARLAFPVSGDTCLDRLAAMPRTAVEPDGSFVWSAPAGDASGSRQWHVWGCLVERDEAVLHVDLRGVCPAEDFDRLLAVMGWPETPVMFQLPRAGVFLDEETFRLRAAAEARGQTGPA